MPRNLSGVYSLPASNPVVPGTLIESTWANQTMNDIAAALTASLPRDGSVGMLGPLILFRAGQVALEAVTFAQFMAVFTDPTFTGTTADGVQITGTKLKVTTLTVELPAATSIGNISAAEIACLEGATLPLQPQFAAKANLDGGNVFTGLQQTLAALADGSTAVTQPATDFSDKLATTHYVHDVAMNAALPSQDATTVGKVPVSDGTAAHWGGIAGNSLYLATNLGAL